ncbi:hypothetical protein V8C35DRAFT_147998 [Trichoderma chlorosporum]
MSRSCALEKWCCLHHQVHRFLPRGGCKLSSRCWCLEPGRCSMVELRAGGAPQKPTVRAVPSTPGSSCSLCITARLRSGGASLFSSSSCILAHFNDCSPAPPLSDYDLALASNFTGAKPLSSALLAFCCIMITFTVPDSPSYLLYSLSSAPRFSCLCSLVTFVILLGPSHRKFYCWSQNYPVMDHQRACKSEADQVARWPALTEFVLWPRLWPSAQCLLCRSSSERPSDHKSTLLETWQLSILSASRISSVFSSKLSFISIHPSCLFSAIPPPGQRRNHDPTAGPALAVSSSHRQAVADTARQK